LARRLPRPAPAPPTDSRRRPRTCARLASISGRCSPPSDQARRSRFPCRHIRAAGRAFPGSLPFARRLPDKSNPARFAPDTLPTMSKSKESGATDALVIFGITGDLAKKMTFRALYRLELRGKLDCPIIGVGRN